VFQVRHRFEDQNSTQTLAEGLSEYFEANPFLKRDDDLLRLACATLMPNMDRSRFKGVSR